MTLLAHLCHGIYLQYKAVKTRFLWVCETGSKTGLHCRCQCPDQLSGRLLNPAVIYNVATAVLLVTYTRHSSSGRLAYTVCCLWWNVLWLHDIILGKNSKQYINFSRMKYLFSHMSQSSALLILLQWFDVPWYIHSRTKSCSSYRTYINRIKYITRTDRQWYWHHFDLLTWAE